MVTTHIVLFLKPNLNINYSILVQKMQESYKELGEGILYENSKLNYNQPNFIFNTNKEIFIEGNHHHISINLFNDYEKIKKDIIEMLWDAFDYCDLEFIRVGYIKEFSKEVNIDSIKEKLLNKTLIREINEFQVAYHQTIKFDRKNINCWKRFIKFNDTPFIINYDINTKEKNINDINYILLNKFLEFSDNYIEEDIKNILEG